MNEKEDLIKFVEELREWLYSIVHAPANHLVADPKLDAYRAAWREVEARFDELLAKLRALTDQELTYMGLGGEQARLKLDAHDKAKRKYSFWPTLRGFKKVLRWSGLIIGSAIDASPAGEAIKELIEALQAGAEEEQEARDDKVKAFGWHQRALHPLVTGPELVKAERRWHALLD